MRKENKTQSLNIKLSLHIAKEMDDKAHLNPTYIGDFIGQLIALRNREQHLDTHVHMKGMAYNYTFKIDRKLHRSLKYWSLDVGLPMNELVGRLFERYYGVYNE